jgi:hypothetical protein
MNCPACHDLLQQRLDGGPAHPAGGDPGTPDQHLQGCPECAALHRAARRLEEGLRLLAPPAPPAGLAGRVSAAVSRARRARARRRRRLVPRALAASLLLVLLAWAYRPWKERPRPTPAPDVPVARQEAPAPDPVPLRESVAEAGSAVASLTTRTADETVGQTRLLLPGPVPPALGGFDVDPPLKPATGPLREAGEGVSAGLEPVTSSVRRAASLLLRDIPAKGLEGLPGL